MSAPNVRSAGDRRDPPVQVPGSPPQRARWARRVARVLVLLFGLQTVLGSAPALAQLVAAPGAPAGQRPLVDAAANGVPIVHIAPPSAAGVSRNQFGQFDVGREGAILNNSGKTVQTQLGGLIGGNLQLGMTPARIVLNEVVSTQPSALRGTIEIAGQRADIVVANPNGIQCDGCGFLNTAGRATLTTGVPQFGARGALEGFDVTRGQIGVGAAGLDASNLERLDLVARGLVIEGQVWAQNLQALTGTQKVLYGTLASTPIAGVGTAPVFAVDIKSLGGMYANQIFLVANEKGLGVNSEGRMAALQGNIELSAAGDLRLHDTHAAGDVKLATPGSVLLTGPTSARGNASVAAAEQIDNRGSLQPDGNLQLTTPRLVNSGSITQGVADRDLVVSASESIRNTGTIQSRAGLRIDTRALSGAADPAAPGQILAAGDLTIAATRVDLSHQRIASDRDIAVAAAATLGLGDSTVRAAGAVSLAGSGAVSLAGSTVSADNGVQLRGGSLSMDRAVVQSGRDADIRAQERAVLSGGRVVARDRVSIAAQGIALEGAEVGATRIVLDAGTAALSNREGRVQASDAGADALVVRAAGVDNRGGQLRTNGTAVLDARGGAVDNGGGAVVAGRTDLQNLGHWTNAGGVLVTGSDLALRQEGFDNRGGTVQTEGQLVLDTRGATLDNRGGVLRAGGALLLDGGAGPMLGEKGTVVAGGDLRIAAGDVGAREATLVAGGDLQVGAARVQLDGARVSSGRNLRIESASDAALAGAQLSSAGNLAVQASGRVLADGATLVAQDAVDIAARGIALATGAVSGRSVRLDAGDAQLDNRGGRVVASGAGPRGLVVQARGIDNTDGVLATAGGAAVSAASGAIRNVGGTLRANGELALEASAIANDRGTIGSGGSLAFSGAELSNRGGTIATGQDLRIDVGNATTAGGTLTAARNLSIRAAVLDAAQARIGSGGDLAIAVAGNADLSQAVVASGRDLDVQATAIQADAARIAADGQATVRTGSLRGGAWSAQGTLDMSATGMVDVAGGALVAGSVLQVRSNGLDTSGAQVGAGTVDLDAGQGSLRNRQGRIVATQAGRGSLTLRAHGIDNGGGTVSAAGDALVSAGSGVFDNTGGVLQAGGVLQLTASQLQNRGGSVSTGGSLALRSGAFDNAGGTVSAGGDLLVDTNGQTLDNTGGRLMAQGALALQAGAGTIASAGGVVTANRDVRIRAGQLDISGGRVSGGQDVDIQVRGPVRAAHATLAAGQDLTVRATDIRASGAAIDAARALDIRADGMLDIAGARIAVQGAGAQTVDLYGTQVDARGTRIRADADLALHAAGALDAAGADIAAGGASQLAAGTALTLTGAQVVANGANRISGERVSARGASLSGGTTLDIRATAGAAELSAAELQSGGTLQVAARGVALDGARVAAVGDVSLDAGAHSLTAGDAAVRSRDGAIAVRAGAIQAASAPPAPSAAPPGFLAATDILLQSGGAIDLSHGTVAAGRNLSVQAQGAVTSRGGLLAARGTGSLTGTSLDNTGGVVDATQALTLETGGGAVVNNGGRIATRAALVLNPQSGAALAALDNRGGTIESGAALDIRAGRTDNRGGTLSAAGALGLRGGAVDNTGGRIAGAGDVRIDTQGAAFQGADGRILSQDGRIDLSAGALDLQRADMLARKDIAVGNAGTAGRVEAQGARLVATDGALTMRLDASTTGFDDAVLQAGGAVALTAQDSTLRRARIDSGADVRLSTGALQAAGLKATAQGALRIEARGAADLQDSTVVAATAASVVATQGLALDRGRLEAGRVSAAAGAGMLTLAGATVTGAGAADGAVPAVELRGQGVDHRGAHTRSGGNLVIDAGSAALDNQGGELLAVGTASLRSQGLDNRAGAIASNGDVVVRANADPAAAAGAGRLDNRAGSIRSAQGDVRLDAGDVFNDAASGAGGRITSARDLSIVAAGVVTNQAGSLGAGRDLSVAASGGLDNRAGTLGAGRHTALDVASLDNRGGLVGGNGSVQVTARGAGIDNTDGTVQSGQGMALRAAGDIGNAHGKMQSGAGLDVAGRAFDNRAGSVSGQGAVAVAGTSWLGARGQVAAGGNLSIDTQGGALDMQDGTLDAQAGLALRAGTADISRLQATAAGTVQIAAADLAAGNARLQSGASVAVSASGRLAADGLAVSAARAVAVDAAQASLQHASLTGNTAVSVRADSLGLQAAQLASQGDVGIAAGGDLDLRSASVRAGQDLAVTGGTGAGGTTQTAGVELMAGRDLSVGVSGAFDLASPDFRYQFGRDLTVRAQGIRTAGATLSGRNLTLDAGGGMLDNTGGSLTASGLLDARGAGVGNQGGTLAANDSVVVDAGSGALANGSGKIYSAQGAARIAGAAIDNRAGTLSAATDLAVAGSSLDNRGGSAVAANALTLDLRGALDNSGGGRVVANTGTLDLKAQGVDNQTGTLSSGAALKVDAGAGTVRNADGTIAATGKVAVAGAALDNQRGSILGTGGLLVGVRGAVDNRGGTLASAQGDTTVDAASLDNSGGQTTGTNVALTATGGSVRNVAGVVSGSRSVRVAGSGVVNDTGVIEAGAGGIAVDAGAGALSNRDSGSTRGIVTTGDLALRAGSIDNQGGYAGANGDITVASAADLDNRGGTLLGLGNGAVSAAGTLDNRGGTIATGGALRVDAGQLHNAGGASLVFAGGDLQVTAGSIDNSGTRDGQYRHGLLAGGNLSVTAATIDNRGGAIVALGDAGITARTRLDNSAGGQIGGNRVTVDTADLVNTGGRIDGAERVTVRAPRFSADGAIASGGTLALAMDQDYTNTGTVSARGSLEISTTGRYTNQGTVSAEQDLSLKAASLDNQAGGRIVSQRTTLDVAGTLSNAGLINSTAGTTAITAGAVDNSGRIYGDSVAVSAGSIANSGSAVIASRAGDLTLTGGVSNTGGAQLLSLGNLAVNGSLRNVGSNVSASGNLGISGRLDNLNAGLVLGTETVSSNAPGAATIMPAGTNDRYPVGDVRYVDDDAGRYVMPSSRYPFDRFGAVARPPDAGLICGTQEDPQCAKANRFTYADNDPVWDTFGVARPDYSGLTEPTPVPDTNNCSTLEGEDTRAGRYTGGGCGAYWNDKDAYDAAHDQRRAEAGQRLDVALAAFNQDVAGRTFEDVYSIEVTGSTTTRNTVLASTPGRITAGGSISLGDGVNQDSVILAGGSLNGGSVQNLATPGQQQVTESGRSQLSHVESCGLDKHCRRTDPWTPFTAAPYTTTQNLDVLQALGSTATGSPAAADNPAPPAGQPAVVPRVGVSLGGSRPASGTGSPQANPGTLAPQDGSIRVVAQPLQVDGAVVVAAQNPRTPGVLDVTATPAVAGTQLSTLPLRIDGPGRLTQGGAVDAPLPGSVIAASARAGQAVAIEQVRSQFAQIAAARPVSQTVVGGTGDSPKAATLAGADAGDPAARGQVKTTGYTTVASGGRLGLPASQLFGTPSRPGAGYLVETDPAFTDQRNYLNSDYYLAQLNLDPERSLKRYADGFGEQRLVDDQVMALSGRRFISGYADSQAQYAALMDSGVAYAKEFQLTPGVALSATQMAQLTTDIVWLETQTVRLPDGSSTQALVPRVYLRQPQAGDLQPSGALIAARDITLKTPGDIVNSGSLRATGNNAAGDNGQLRITAGNIANSGTIAGGAITIRAQTDLRNLGGQILGQGAGSTIALSAGRDLVLQTTTQSSSLATPTSTSTSSRTNLDRIATVQGGSIDLQAARDLIARGATVSATGDATKHSGTLVASAGRDIAIGTVQERYQLAIANAGGPVVQGRSTGYSEASTTNIGSAFAAKADISLAAGRQLDITGSGIAAVGNATLGGANVNIGAATDTRSVSLQAVGKNGYQNAASSAQTAAGSRISAGNDLRIVANGKAADGQGDIAIRGSSLSAGTASGANTGVLALQATRDITIGTAGTASSRQTESYSKSSGLVSTATSRSQSQSDLQGVQGSSLDGKTVSIGAGRDLGVVGSSIVADRNVSLFAGRDIAIAAASQTQTQTASASSSKSGLMSSGMGVTVGSQSQTSNNQGASTTTVASTVGSIGGNVSIVAGNRVGIVGSDLMAPAGDIAIAGKSVAITEARDTASSQSRQTVKQSGLTLSVTAPALAALQSASSTLDATGNTKSSRMQALGAASAAMSVKTAADSLQTAGAAMEAGKSAGDVAKAAGVGVNITVGGSKSSSTSSQKSDTARASTINAGGSIAITATGAGKDSSITLQGVQANAGRDVDLKADGDINLLASRNDSEQHSSNKSSSASIGVGITFGPKLAYGVTAAASSARGQADGADTSYTGTRIAAGNAARIESGGDTTLRGATVAANKVQANVGGDLSIESLQDTSRYDSKQSNAGGSITVGLAGGVTGSASIGNAKVNANYASVTDQSGLKAGDGGFQVDVGGKTALKGGAITSSESAVQNGANRFASAGGTTLEDIQNRDDYKAKGLSLSEGYGKSEGSGNNPGNLQNFAGGTPGGGAVGYGYAKGSQSSTTASAISGIAGDTQARTGDQRSGALAKTWDGQQLEREVQAQKQITATFGQQATKKWGEFANGQQAAAQAAHDPQGETCWAETGACRVAGHALLGGLTGGAGGALGAGVSAASVETVAGAADKIGLTGAARDLFIAGVNTSVGAAVGGAAGAAGAHNEVVNNYLSHVRPSPMRLSEAERYEAATAACGKGDAAACDTRNALAQTSAQRDRDLAQACSGATPDACAVRVGEATAMGNTVRTTEGGYVYATSPTLTQLNPSTIGNPKRPDSFHDSLAQSTADGILVEAGNQAIVAVVAPIVKGGSAIVGMVKGPVGDLAPSTTTTTGIAATDGTATSAYSSAGRNYGSTTVTDAGGNVVATQPTLPRAAGRGAGATDAADLGVGASGGVVAGEVAVTTKPLTLPAPKVGEVVPNAMSAAETTQAADIVAFKGGTFVGQPTSNTPGIDGWLNGVPVSLKEVTGNGMTAVQRNVIGGTNQMSKAGQVGDMYIDATKAGVSTQDVTNWVKPGSPIANVLNEGTVKNINIKTTNGWVTLTRSTLKTPGTP
ncbi:hemagglutinin repeat-containing protein [Sphingomonas sp. NCPPB 2930]